jgi:hypothetical protein
MAYSYTGDSDNPKQVEQPKVRDACGTNGGYRQHYYYGDPLCLDCVEARRAYRRELEARKKSHGTPAGYKKHRRNNEEPCDPCRAANAAYIAEYRARKKEGIAA